MTPYRVAVVDDLERDRAWLAEKLAEHYKDYDNIVAWHISNEYGGECYCENCEKAFRVWLKKKYHTIEEVNRVWDTAFWGHTFYDWEEIVLPNLLSEHFAYERTMFQGISLDYRRFNSDSILECYRLEYEADLSVGFEILSVCFAKLVNARISGSLNVIVEGLLIL